jgi:hypothetical protein
MAVEFRLIVGWFGFADNLCRESVLSMASGRTRVRPRTENARISAETARPPMTKAEREQRNEVA